MRNDLPDGSLFKMQADRLFQKAENARLAILVWGTGARTASTNRNAQRNYEKRLQIKAALRETFPKADVFLSEDQEITSGKVASIPDEELVQANSADIIFALDTAQGVGEEIARFSSFEDIAKKLVVLCPKAAGNMSGFAASIRQSLHVERYSKGDFDSCHLAKQTVVNHVRTVAVRRLLSKPRHPYG